MLIEDSPYTDQYYKYSDGEKPPYEFLKNEWRQGRRILAANLPLSVGLHLRLIIVVMVVSSTVTIRKLVLLI